MSAYLLPAALVALVLFGPVLITRALAGKPDSEDAAKSLAYFARLRSLPETTAFDPPVDVTRARLRVVEPLPPLRRVPEQRQPYDVERQGL